MEAQELKPCPWCRKPPRLYPAQDGSGFESIECDNPDCLFRPSYGYGPFDEVVAAWNTRVPDPDLEAHIGAVLEEAADVAGSDWVYEKDAKAARDKIRAIHPNALQALERVRREARVEGMQVALDELRTLHKSMARFLRVGTWEGYKQGVTDAENVIRARIEAERGKP